MIDAKQAKKIRELTRVTRTALLEGRNDLRGDILAMDSPDAQAFTPEYRTAKKIEARREKRKAAKPLLDAVLQHAEALKGLRAHVGNRALLALTADIVPPLAPFNPRELVPGLADFQIEEFRRAHAAEQRDRALLNTMQKSTWMERLRSTSTARLGPLLDHAVATENWWLAGAIGDAAHTRTGADAKALQQRADRALDAMALPPEQAEVLEHLDAIDRDVKACGELYRQIADPNADLSALTTTEFADAIAEKAAEDPETAAQRYGAERMAQRRQQGREASERVRKQIRRIGGAPQPEPAPAAPLVPGAPTEPTAESA